MFLQPHKEKVEALEDEEEKDYICASDNNTVETFHDTPPVPSNKVEPASYDDTISDAILDDDDPVEPVSIAPRKLDDMHISVDDIRTADVESINSSRSSEMDDGYSSLHKLDNLSPTLTEDSSSKVSTDGEQDTSRSDCDVKQEEEVQDVVVIDAKQKPVEISFDDRFQSTFPQEDSGYGYADPEDRIQVRTRFY